MSRSEFEFAYDHIQKLLERRQAATSFYFSVNTGVMAALGLLLKDYELTGRCWTGVVAVLLIAGFFACWIWQGQGADALPQPPAFPRWWGAGGRAACERAIWRCSRQTLLNTSVPPSCVTTLESVEACLSNPKPGVCATVRLRSRQSLWVPETPGFRQMDYSVASARNCLALSVKNSACTRIPFPRKARGSSSCSKARASGAPSKKASYTATWMV
jgi:hypothetical protein